MPPNVAPAWSFPIRGPPGNPAAHAEAPLSPPLGLGLAAAGGRESVGSGNGQRDRGNQNCANANQGAQENQQQPWLARARWRESAIANGGSGGEEDGASEQRRGSHPSV